MKNHNLQLPYGYTGGVVVNVSGGDQSLGRFADAIYSGGASTFVVTTADGADLTIVVPAGTLVPIRFSAVKQSGTTNANGVVLWFIG